MRRATTWPMGCIFWSNASLPDATTVHDVCRSHTIRVPTPIHARTVRWNRGIRKHPNQLSEIRGLRTEHRTGGDPPRGDCSRRGLRLGTVDHQNRRSEQTGRAGPHGGFARETFFEEGESDHQNRRSEQSGCAGPTECGAGSGNRAPTTWPVSHRSPSTLHRADNTRTRGSRSGQRTCAHGKGQEACSRSRSTMAVKTGKESRPCWSYRS